MNKLNSMLTSRNLKLLKNQLALIEALDESPGVEVYATNRELIVKETGLTFKIDIDACIDPNRYILDIATKMPITHEIFSHHDFHTTSQANLHLVVVTTNGDFIVLDDDVPKYRVVDACSRRVSDVIGYIHKGVKYTTNPHGLVSIVNELCKGFFIDLDKDYRILPAGDAPYCNLTEYYVKQVEYYASDLAILPRVEIIVPQSALNTEMQ